MALSNETRIFSDRRYPPLPAWRLVWQGNEPANKVLSAMPPELQRHIIVAGELIPARATRVTEEGVVTP